MPATQVYAAVGDGVNRLGPALFASATVVVSLVILTDLNLDVSSSHNLRTLKLVLVCVCGLQFIGATAWLISIVRE